MTPPADWLDSLLLSADLSSSAESSASALSRAFELEWARLNWATGLVQRGGGWPKPPPNKDTADEVSAFLVSLTAHMLLREGALCAEGYEFLNDLTQSETDHQTRLTQLRSVVALSSGFSIELPGFMQALINYDRAKKTRFAATAVSILERMIMLLASCDVAIGSGNGDFTTRYITCLRRRLLAAGIFQVGTPKFSKEPSS